MRSRWALVRPDRPGGRAGRCRRGACHKKVPPVARPIPPPPPRHDRRGADQAAGAARAGEGAGRWSRPRRSSRTGWRRPSLDEINKNSPLKPVFFDYDSSEISARGASRSSTANAEVLKKNPTWVITIEGHCDERGTAEYNLALGERRAVAARTYLVSLGIPADRMRTVELRQGVPVRPGAQRGGVGEEPARPLRGHAEVENRAARWDSRHGSAIHRH